MNEIFYINYPVQNIWLYPINKNTLHYLVIPVAKNMLFEKIKFYVKTINPVTCKFGLHPITSYGEPISTYLDSVIKTVNSPNLSWVEFKFNGVSRLDENQTVVVSFNTSDILYIAFTEDKMTLKNLTTYNFSYFILNNDHLNGPFSKKFLINIENTLIVEEGNQYE